MPPKADVRRLLKKQQDERNKIKKVTHPFAKYDETSRLMCIVCNSPVKSEAVWQAHLGSLGHRDNIQKLKALKQQQQQSLKRRAPSPPPQEVNKRVRTQKMQDIELDEQVSSSDEEMDLPNDFFDARQEEEVMEEVEEVEEEAEEENGAIPTGFFDDPEEEARIQGTLAPEEQAQADLEKDLAMFNEAMIDVTKEAKEDQDQDDETFWLERHDDISREQEMFDKRVESLKLMRQSGKVVKQTKPVDEDEIRVGLKSSVRQLLKSKPVKHTESIFDDDESDSEEEEDWRAQQL
ncbi:hypothetical protein INT47_006681 [Mucor saturninus]|uniref:U1-type domain-containing protein n=1 Tax=Mucor saturninus TaxID=64648 RepID=A0A8H7UZB8_9FUNG|nr:hypothetical protein INT47_006681 [Mucor saturninus]